MNRAERRRREKEARKGAKAGGRKSNLPQPALNVDEAVEAALRHHSAGRFSQAEEVYRRILQADPGHPAALHLLGVLAHQKGENEVAVDLISKALAASPDYVEAYNNCGVALRALRRFDEAAACYRKAVAIAPRYAEAHYNLGNILRETGKWDEAVASYREALALNPDYADAHLNLGNVLSELGKSDEAAASYRKALAIVPNSADAQANLGRALVASGDIEEGIARLRQAVSADPGNTGTWRVFAESLESVSFASADDGLRRDLLLLLEQSAVSPHKVVMPIVDALRLDPAFSRIFDLPGTDIASELSGIPLFLRILELSPIYDLEVERALTDLRRLLLKEAVAGEAMEGALPFLAALALQCFVNEYVYFETAEETVDVERLGEAVSERVHGNEEVPPSHLAVLGAYRPLHGFPWAGGLCGRDWPEGIAMVVERQVSEPLEERSLRAQIPSVTPIEGAVSTAVREQYEENPYPRWIRTDVSDGRDIHHDLFGDGYRPPGLEDFDFLDAPEILVAGCGTGEHAIDVASRFPGGRVLAVDLSSSSLSYALRKTRELGVSNIEYVQGDILELSVLERRFDLIECVGVLHHLGDPLVGWRVLTGLLRPGGLMKVGLYSELGRRDVVAGRALIAEKGYTATAECIRSCRRDIVAMAENGNRDMAGIRDRRSFFSTSECRDLLFNVQEIRFTIPMIRDAVGSLGLMFLRFELGRDAVDGFLRDKAGKDALGSLSLWDEFEAANPETFRAMYRFWVRKG